MLNEMQKKLVNDSIGTIYFVCNLHKISYEEYFDVLAIKMCEYAETCETEQDFVQDLLVTLEDACEKIIEKETDKTFEVIPKGHFIRIRTSNEDDSISKEDFLRFYRGLSESDKMLLTLKYLGYTKEEIAREMETNLYSVSVRLAVLRQCIERI